MEERLDALIRRAGEGDGDAVAELVGRFGGAVRAAVRRRLPKALRAREDSEDLLQTALVAALARLSSFEFQGEKAFVSWLTSVAQQEVALVHRRHSAKKRDFAKDRGLTQAGGVSIERTTASQAAMRAEDRVRLDVALAELTEQERAVVRSRSYDELSFKEVAERVGLADAEAARTIYRRALRLLGRHLAEQATEGVEGIS